MTRRLCLLCDEWYDVENESSVKIHEHPEPQKGPYREKWIASKLPYSDWIWRTESGRAWAKEQTQCQICESSNE